MAPHVLAKRTADTADVERICKADPSRLSGVARRSESLINVTGLLMKSRFNFK